MATHMQIDRSTTAFTDILKQVERDQGTNSAHHVRLKSDGRTLHIRADAGAGMNFLTGIKDLFVGNDRRQQGLAVIREAIGREYKLTDAQLNTLFTNINGGIRANQLLELQQRAQEMKGSPAAAVPEVPAAANEPAPVRVAKKLSELGTNTQEGVARGAIRSLYMMPADADRLSGVIKAAGESLERKDLLADHHLISSRSFQFRDGEAVTNPILQKIIAAVIDRGRNLTSSQFLLQFKGDNRVEMLRFIEDAARQAVTSFAESEALKATEDAARQAVTSFAESEDLEATLEQARQVRLEQTSRVRQEARHIGARTPIKEVDEVQETDEDESQIGRSANGET